MEKSTTNFKVSDIDLNNLEALDVKPAKLGDTKISKQSLEIIGSDMLDITEDINKLSGNADSLSTKGEKIKELPIIKKFFPEGGKIDTDKVAVSLENKVLDMHNTISNIKNNSIEGIAQAKENIELIEVAKSKADFAVENFTEICEQFNIGEDELEKRQQLLQELSDIAMLQGQKLLLEQGNLANLVGVNNLAKKAERYNESLQQLVPNIINAVRTTGVAAQLTEIQQTTDKIFSAGTEMVIKSSKVIQKGIEDSYIKKIEREEDFLNMAKEIQNDIEKGKITQAEFLDPNSNINKKRAALQVEIDKVSKDLSKSIELQDSQLETLFIK